jgi:hypothetical protein
MPLNRIQHKIRCRRAWSLVRSRSPPPVRKLAKTNLSKRPSPCDAIFACSLQSPTSNTIWSYCSSFPPFPILLLLWQLLVDLDLQVVVSFAYCTKKLSQHLDWWIQNSVLSATLNQFFNDHMLHWWVNKVNTCNTIFFLIILQLSAPWNCE